MEAICFYPNEAIRRDTYGAPQASLLLVVLQDRHKLQTVQVRIAKPAPNMSKSTKTETHLKNRGIPRTCNAECASVGFLERRMHQTKHCLGKNTQNIYRSTSGFKAPARPPPHAPALAPALAPAPKIDPSTGILTLYTWTLPCKWGCPFFLVEKTMFQMGTNVF